MGLRGELDLGTASGRMIARQLGAVARYESEQTAGRTRAGKADAASRGAWQGGQRVYGYELVPLGERALGGSALRVVAEEAELVQETMPRKVCGALLGLGTRAYRLQDEPCYRPPNRSAVPRGRSS